MFNMTLKYFSIFNNKPPASWAAYITMDILRCYSCEMCSMLKIKTPGKRQQDGSGIFIIDFGNDFASWNGIV